MADARLITPAALQAALHDGGEIALQYVHLVLLCILLYTDRIR